jgi:nuclear transport factor 2 (NTF2) superfamily protein
MQGLGRPSTVRGALEFLAHALAESPPLASTFQWMCRRTKIGKHAARSLPFSRSPAMDRPPLPPFTTETAAQKARMAEDAWNTRDPARVALAYTTDSRWRNRAEFLQGRDAIQAFLTRKWTSEIDYRLIKEVWAFRDNRIAVRFAYEWRDDSGHWFRSYGNENWEFDEHGLMRLRIASINDLPIAERERKYHWPLGRRPDEHPSLSDLDL